ncbi:MAG: TonB-dependent receptor [Pseudomonadota bacterium]
MKNPSLALKMTCALGALAFATPALAQDPVTVPDQAEQDQRTLDRVVVTGSFIRRTNQADIASPLTTVGSANIGEIGAQNIGDITQTLTINTGAQNNPDAFTQGGTTGTSNINLRGLGLQSTLVLLNGHRQVLSAQQTNDGISFVDTNSLVPLIAIDRLEILTDGASALYGSDAVAGVANFITVTNFDGVRFSTNYQFHTPGGESQDDFRIEGLVGKTWDRGSALIAASYFDRSQLTTEERRLSPLFGPDASSLGNPGAFFLLPPAGSPLEALAGTPIIDPTGCAEPGGNPLLLAPPGTAPAGLDIGLCQFDFGDFFNLVPEEERVNVYAEADYEVTDTITASLNYSFANFDVGRGNSPTFPFLQTAIVPGDAPTNIFSAALGSPLNVNFFGRAIGNGGSVSPATFDSQTNRINLKLENDQFLKNGFWEIAYTFAENDFTTATEDTVTTRFQCALGGIQGTDAPNLSAGGAQNCGSFVGLENSIPVGDIFNPFATSFSVAPNSPEILDFIIDTAVDASTSRLHVVDLVTGTELFDLPAGPVAIATGFQYRNDRLISNTDAISEADGFGFLIGGQSFDDSIDVYALFAEVSVPLTSWLDVDAAVRFEDFGENGGTTVDPKVGILIRPTDNLSLRGTYSTSFRAPTVFQQFGQSTSLNNVADPGPDGIIGTADDAASSFAAVRAFGSAVADVDLEPESSRAFSAGVTFEPFENLVLDVDYYNFEFDDAITQVSFQALVNANPIDTRTFAGGVAVEPCLAEFTIVCRAGDPVAGAITQVNTNFTNAEAIDTSGIDFSIQYTFDADRWGTFRPSFEGTYIIDYDIIDPTAGEIDGEGSRNFTNIGAPTPQLRWNAGLTYSNGPFFYNFFARFIDDLEDDQNPGMTVDDQTRFDMQWGVDLAEWINLTESAVFTVGVTNLTDEEPPLVLTGGGFESRVHDPRGRLVRFGLNIEF